MKLNIEVNTSTFGDGHVTTILYMDGYEHDNMELVEAEKLYAALGEAIARAHAMEAAHERYKKGGEQ